MDDNLYGIYFELLASYVFWLALLLSIFLTLLPDVIHSIIQNTFEQQGFSALRKRIVSYDMIRKQINQLSN